MAKDPGLKRNYTEKETARILRRAAEIQGRETSSKPAGDGISPDELLRIGQEVGLDRESLRAAMDGLEEDGDEVQARWLGAPPSYEVERVLEGTLTDDHWNVLVGELNSTFHQSIEGVNSGPVRTWHWKSELGKVHFSATQAANSVRLKLNVHIDDGIAVGMIMTILAMLIGSAVTWSFDALRPYLSFLLMTIYLVGMGLWFRSITSKWYRRDRRKMVRLLDQMEERLKELGPAVSVPEASIEPVDENLEQRLGQG